MVLRLALRNIRLSLVSRLPQASLVAGALALLLAGNSLLESSRLGLKQTYVNAFTGDWSVSARAPDNFTLFGSDLPLIGEYVVTPALPPADRWTAVVAGLGPDVRSLPQVSASALLLLPDEKREAVPVFGVDFGAYFRFFPTLRLVKGTLTPEFPHALLVNRNRYQALTTALGHEPALGEGFDLGMSVNGSLVIRTVRLAGVYEYPGSDALADRALLVDAQTARSLNGYTAGATWAETPDPQTTNLLDANLDDVFGAPDTVADPAKAQTVADTEKALADTRTRDALNQTLDDRWNFVLFQSAHSDDLGPRLQAAFARAGLDVQVRDWTLTAGGNALVVALLQALFSVGLGFIALVTVLIVMNNLALSVVERTQEIGTMRALGASRGLVGRVLAAETFVVVAGSALVGLGVASLVLVLGRGWGVPVTNPVLVSLLGTPVLKPVLTVPLVVGHLALVLALGLVACWLPVRRALAISPRQAMQQE